MEEQPSESERYGDLDGGLSTYGVVKRKRDNDMDLHSNKQVRRWLAVAGIFIEGILKFLAALFQETCIKFKTCHTDYICFVLCSCAYIVIPLFRHVLV